MTLQHSSPIPIKCRCGRHIYLYFESGTHLAHCDCGRIWQLIEIQGPRETNEKRKEIRS